MDREMYDPDHWAVSPPSSPIEDEKPSFTPLPRGLRRQWQHEQLFLAAKSRRASEGTQDRMTEEDVEEMPDLDDQEPTTIEELVYGRGYLSRLSEHHRYSQQHPTGPSTGSRGIVGLTAQPSSSFDPPDANSAPPRRPRRPRRQASTHDEVDPIDHVQRSPALHAPPLLRSRNDATLEAYLSNMDAINNNGAFPGQSATSLQSWTSRSFGDEIATAPYVRRHIPGENAVGDSAPPTGQAQAPAPIGHTSWPAPFEYLMSDRDNVENDSRPHTQLGNLGPSPYGHPRTRGTRNETFSIAMNQQFQGPPSPSRLEHRGGNQTAQSRRPALSTAVVPNSFSSHSLGALDTLGNTAAHAYRAGRGRRGYYGVSFPHTDDSDSLSEDAEPELQSRKRRRGHGPTAPTSVTEPEFPGHRDSNTISARLRANRRPGSRGGVNVCRRNAGPSHVTNSSTQTDNPLPLHSGLTSNPSGIVYLAELIPRRIRPQVLHVLQDCAPYLPHIFVRSGKVMHNVVSELASCWKGRGRRSRRRPFRESSLIWPANKIPLEVFEKVASYLSRDDLISLRGVNGEFEKKVSARVFRAVVVPFNPDIYALTNSNTAKIGLPASKNNGKRKDKGKGPESDKGKGKPKETCDSEEGESQHHLIKSARKAHNIDCSWVPGIVDAHNRIPDGMQIFRAWGEHIRQFAMAFEVDEASMSNPPRKGLYQTFVSFWGDYQWPHQQYNRYAACERTENLADETKCMKQALSYLSSVTELGLSLDNGLGWIQSPDTSDRARLFKRSATIFNTQYAEPNDEELFAAEVWESSKDVFSDRRRPTFVTVLVSGANDSMPQVAWASAATPEDYPPIVFGGKDAEAHSETSLRARSSEDSQSSSANEGLSSHSLVPKALTDGQIQWLLENGWAQRAFLSSFCVSLMDNATIFAHVETLNIAKLSSKYLTDLTRRDLWAALPKLTKVILAVSPDWRDVIKEPTGSVHDLPIKPSSAGSQFYSMLDACIKECKEITTLDLGWVGGGEKAEGIFARNQNILPAPVLDFGSGNISMQLRCNILSLPHVENLTLRNCWFQPPALKQFVNDLQNLSLKTLTLDSVSLTAMPGSPNLVPPNQNQALGMNAAGLAQWAALANAPPAAPGIGQPGGVLAFNTDDHDHHTQCHAALPGGHVIMGRAEQIEWAKPLSTICLEEKPREGSWPDVIDAITPGATLEQKKYLHGIIDERRIAPDIRNIGSLQRIEFISCGYLRLTHLKIFNQDPICLVMSKPPQCLLHRTADLKNVMMSAANDPLLGYIAPAVSKHEMDTLQVAWNMRMGWEDDDASKYHNREDAQPVGGSGRFSGAVVKGDGTATG